MYQSSFFNSKDGDRIYKAEDWAEYFASFIGNGVFPAPSTNLQVQQGTGMQVSIRAGRAWINGYFFTNKSDCPLTLDTADGVYRRIDRIVLRWSKEGRFITPIIKKGTPSPTPAAPVLQRNDDAYELALADISVDKGVISITQANITDQRLNTALCGIVKGTVEEIDTTTLFAQFESWFDSFRAENMQEFMEWFDVAKEFLNEHVASQLRDLIETKQNKITANGILKCNGSAVTAAAPDVDYVLPETAARILYTAITVYLNADTGSDENDGLSAATAWKTSQRLMQELDGYHIFKGTVTINLAPGTYSSITISEKHFANLLISGSTTDPASYKISPYFYRCNGYIRVRGIKASAINVTYSDYVSISNCEFESTTSAFAVALTASKARVENCKVVGPPSAGFNASDCSMLYSYVNTSTATLNTALYISSSIVFKYGSQLTGNESKSGGGQIFQ